SVGNQAFRGCTELTSVTIPDGVTYIGTNAFAKCSSLTVITVPESVEFIGEDAFPTDNKDLIIHGYIGSLAEQYAKEAGIRFVSLGTASKTPDPPAADGRQRFCYGLTWRFDEAAGTLYIEGTGKMPAFGTRERTDRLEADVYSPWADKTGIEKVVMQDGITNIGDYSFQGCSNMKEISVPDTVTRIGSHAFYHCTALTENPIPAHVTEIGSFAFYECTVLKEALIPDGLTVIEACTFEGCTALTNVSIPDTVISIGNFAFNRCRNLTEFEIPDSVTTLGEAVFNDCIGLQSIRVPDSVTDSGRYTFSGCSGLTELILPNNLNGVWDSICADCTALKSLTIPEGITGFMRDPFIGCTALVEITFPKSVRTLSRNIFVNLKSFQDGTLTIKGYSGSAAEKFAETNHIPFVSLDTAPLWGDANCDSAVDISDAVLICRFAVSDIEAVITDQGKSNADVTHDGSVSAEDSQKLLRYIAKQLTADDLKE
ncbi:MAG: leucine-rich repeat protein, partial [Oscillospiraceae bacterium]|nr:leucine-rich repeat protein [Oscillospiraceae bacterium]